ncbi:MAG TPA: YciK family oxidoreductase [Gammaproteobacteria bacterium]|nr:YciK family oxidoreductase [Gammaproteobacteria bacterium]
MPEPTPLPAYDPPPQVLADRVILITGAGDGIGKAVSLACGSFGATVILLGRTVRKLEKVYDAIVEAEGPKPAIYPMDLSGATAQHYDELAENVDKEFGRLDGLLHNAAHLKALSSMENSDPEDWALSFQVNVHAPYLLTRACLPLLRKSDDARIVFTGAAEGRRGRAYWGAYAASKAAAERMMEVLADELEATPNVRVNSIDPGPTRTRLRQAAYPGKNPGSYKAAEAIADAYVYLLGPESRDHNGVRFTINDA